MGFCRDVDKAIISISPIRSKPSFMMWNVSFSCANSIVWRWDRTHFFIPITFFRITQAPSPELERESLEHCDSALRGVMSNQPSHRRKSYPHSTVLGKNLHPGDGEDIPKGNVSKLFLHVFPGFVCTGIEQSFIDLRCFGRVGFHEHASTFFPKGSNSRPRESGPTADDKTTRKDSAGEDANPKGTQWFISGSSRSVILPSVSLEGLPISMAPCATSNPT